METAQTNEKNQQSSFDLEEELKLLNSYRTDVASARSVLARAEREYEKGKDLSERLLKDALRKGWSSGDPVCDQALAYYGLSEKAFPSYCESNAELVNAAGKLLLVILRDYQTIGSQSMNLTHYLGVLTGEDIDLRTELTGSNELSLSLPLSSFVKWNHFEEIQPPTKGKLIFSQCSHDQALTELLKRLGGQDSGYAEMHILSGPTDFDQLVTSSESNASVGLILTLEDAYAVLTGA